SSPLSSTTAGSGGPTSGSSAGHEGWPRASRGGSCGGAAPTADPPRAAAERLGRRPGLGVGQLLDGSPAAAAGVRAGDVIVSIGERGIAGVGDLQRALVGDLVDRPLGVAIERV